MLRDSDTDGVADSFIIINIYKQYANMNIDKFKILNKICFTELVYGRVAKKLNIENHKEKIEELIGSIIQETEISAFQKTGKNFYITNRKRNISITVNSFIYRLITADSLVKIKP
jgi:hypothetical protein